MCSNPGEEIMRGEDWENVNQRDKGEGGKMRVGRQKGQSRREREAS